MPKMLGNTFHHESGYRSVNLETIKEISINGEHFTIDPEPITKTVNLSMTNKPTADNLVPIEDGHLEALKA